MTLFSVDKLTYSGSDLASAIEAEIDEQRDFTHLRLEPYVDTTNHRDPFVITATADQVEQDFVIDRGWEVSQHLTFGLFASPKESVSDNSSTNQPYYQANEVHLGTATLRPSESTPVDLAFDGELQLHFGAASAPGPEMENGEVKWPTEVNVALSDFRADEDTGPDFIDKSAVVGVAEKLSNRLDATGVEDSPDGYPDEAVDIVDQDEHGYCASASLLFNFACHFPRRLVELCRSIYDPMSYHDAGFHGYLTRQITFDRNRLFLHNTYQTQTDIHNRSPEAAYVDTIQGWFRETLSDIRPHHDEVSNEHSSSQGMNAAESQAMMNELMELEGTTTSSAKSVSRGGITPLRNAKGAVVDEHLNTLSLDGALVDPDVSLTDEPSNDHAITLLDSNVPRTTDDHATVPTQIELVFQNPWGGKASRVTVSKADVEKAVFLATVGEL